jgi:hypothetical protein
MKTPIVVKTGLTAITKTSLGTPIKLGIQKSAETVVKRNKDAGVMISYCLLIN